MGAAAPPTICAPWCAAGDDAEPEPWAKAFDDWLAETVEKGDEAALADYRTRGAQCPRGPSDR